MRQKSAPPPTGGRIVVSVFDGSRKPLTGVRCLLTVKDGNQRVQKRGHFTKTTVLFDGLPVFNNFGDNYTVLAAASGFRDSGVFPVRVAANVLRSAELMLLPKSSRFDFGPARWAELDRNRPDLKRLLSAGAPSPDEARKRYEALAGKDDGTTLACLLNIAAALGSTILPQGNALQYVKEIDFSRVAPDRLFAFAEAALLDQVELAVAQGVFEPAPSTLHKGATRSFKQIQFGEANLQLTFHENDRKRIGGRNCILIEPDIDYFRDPGAHTLLEVIPNALGGITDPRIVYQLRWVAGRRAGIPEFDPLYSIVEA